MATATKAKMPLDGDFTGRGTWANNIIFCAYVHRTFKGKPIAPVQCLWEAVKGSKYCKHHTL